MSQRLFKAHYASARDGRKTPLCASNVASVRQRSRIKADIMAVNTDVLNSWKEVATYLGRGIRTVQRWERELGLPIRRPRGKLRSPIIAFRPELDHWLQSAPTAEQLAREDGLAKKDGPAKDERSHGLGLRHAA